MSLIKVLRYACSAVRGEGVEQGVRYLHHRQNRGSAS